MKLDVFDDHYHLLGQCDKDLVHRLGLWHRVFTCLVFNPKSGLAFFQLKAPGKYDFDRPDYLDVSVGGHYEAGEAVNDGVREISEELGLVIPFDKLIPLGIRQTAATISPTYIANEFQHLFLLPIDIELKDLIPSCDEVSGFVAVPIREVIKLLRFEVDVIYAEKSTLNASACMISETEVERTSFPPAYIEIDNLIERLLIAAVRYISGELPNNIYW